MASRIRSRVGRRPRNLINMLEVLETHADFEIQIAYLTPGQERRVFAQIGTA
jgi:hypothetical protein